MLITHRAQRVKVLGRAVRQRVVILGCELPSP